MRASRLIESILAELVVKGGARDTENLGAAYVYVRKGTVWSPQKEGSQQHPCWSSRISCDMMRPTGLFYHPIEVMGNRTEKGMCVELAQYKSGTTKSVPPEEGGASSALSPLHGQVLSHMFCPILLPSTRERPVYGRPQSNTQPTSAFKIPIPRANSAQRGGAGCAEDDPHRRIPERSSDECHPPNRSPQ